MKQKAINNLKTAQILANNREECGYSSSIHCSYYAVFQYLKYMLAHTDKNPIAYDKQDISDSGSHEFILTEIVNRVKDFKNGRDLAQRVRFLKRKRKDADYTPRNFSLDECLGCKEEAVGIISKLKQYFGNL